MKEKLEIDIETLACYKDNIFNVLITNMFKLLTLFHLVHFLLSNITGFTLSKS